ncbi:hypothetical protein [Dyella sp.]|uniref:hypothetical protein n=1 Tax=Dyella sp. TaxID=1869338 RepID=UPI00284C9AF7|nr:hypothetical protein [Dyella sp.]MDR3444470.1 hypothetical protein [Dyella sp.]
MTERKTFISILCLVSIALSLSACANGPKDIRVTSVSDANFLTETQLDWISQKPRPSIVISKIEFTTNTDLLALARKHDFNVSFRVGACSKDGVKDEVARYGGVYWHKAQIYFSTKDADVPGYAEAIAKGPYTYDVYVGKLPANPPAPLCLTLAGGNMVGGRLRSNDAIIPNP